LGGTTGIEEPGPLEVGGTAPQTARPLMLGKLRVPPTGTSYQARPRLTGQLDGALGEDIRLTLVSAAPGYGKSVAVAAWVAERSLSTAWLSLDAGDNDLVRFVRYLAAGLRQARPELTEAGTALLGGDARPTPEEAAAVLIDAIAARDDPLVLVVDDYHVISAPPVHALVRLLIEQGPPCLHLVLLTREDPALPLARLRGHGHLLELRAADLRFTGDELTDYLGHAGVVTLDAEHQARLLARTEGWAAGLQLAALALRARPDPALLVDAVAGSRRFVLDYLADEVLARLDEELRAFLPPLAVCPRFCSELAQALTGRGDAGPLLERAERLNLFLIPLDPERSWFRFHHLFADYLRTLLPTADQTALYTRAAAWCEEAGLDPEAIDYALAAGDVSRALSLLERVAPSTYQTGELDTLLRWLDALPAEAVAANTELTSLRACAYFFMGRFGEAARACSDAEQSSEDGRLLAIRALLATVAGSPEAGSLASVALERLERGDAFRPLALQALGTAQVVRGELVEAVGTTRETIELGLAQRRPLVVTPALTMLATALNLTGRRSEAETWCRRILAEYRGPGGALRGGLAYVAYWLGMLRYEADDLGEARRLLELAWQAAGRWGSGHVLISTSVAYLALARFASGASDEAFGLLEEFRREVRGAGAGVLEAALSEIEARLLVLHGEVGRAGRWADAVDSSRPGGSDTSAWHGLPIEVTLARVRLAQGRPDQAAAHLRRAHAAATAAGDVADLISIRALEAVQAERAGDGRMAQRALEAAIVLAAPEGYLRRVIDDASGVAHLFPAARHVMPAFVDHVAAALADSARGPRPRGVEMALWRTGQGEVIEALTARELDVLRLMAAGQGDAAIADALTVSLTTAKWHAAHVRAKLGAKTRTQALLRAQELGLV
jgi:ATP/maltotriose-dependent transcriptional regulator MalT